MTYSTYTTAKQGVILGLSITQLVTLSLASLPIWAAISTQRWSAAVLWSMVWAMVLLLVAVPLGGRSAIGWCAAAVTFATAGLCGWSTFRSKAATGKVRDLDTPDMPGALAGVEILEGLPQGVEQHRMAVIKNSASRVWAITAAITHDGIAMVDEHTRNRFAAGLTSMLDTAARGELVDEIHLMVRANPDDCTERELWLREHIVDGAPDSSVVSQIEHLRWSHAGVRTETFITVVVPESRLAKEAKQMGGSLSGRLSTLQSVAAEIGAVITGDLGASDVRWLTSPQLAKVIRLGFAPGDRAGLVAADHDPTQHAEVPWALAGPSGAFAAVRHYQHDAWNTITSTVKLPAGGSRFAALAPVLWPSDSVERRSVTIVFPIEKQSAADRKAETQQFGQSIGQSLKDHFGLRTAEKDKQEAARVHRVEHQLALGSAMTHPYVLCATTVPSTAPINEFGRRLDASIRRSGMAPQRLDMSQDLAFVAATIPVGISLGRNDRP